MEDVRQIVRLVTVVIQHNWALSHSLSCVTQQFYYLIQKLVLDAPSALQGKQWAVGKPVVIQSVKSWAAHVNGPSVFVCHSSVTE